MTNFENAEPQSFDQNRIHFSPREAEVPALLLKGYSSKEIARELNISPRTVDIYRSAILGKLRVNKTAQLFLAIQKLNLNITGFFLNFASPDPGRKSSPP